jgi:hypothetical protein
VLEALSLADRTRESQAKKSSYGSQGATESDA